MSVARQLNPTLHSNREGEDIRIASTHHLHEAHNWKGVLPKEVVGLTTVTHKGGNVNQFLGHVFHFARCWGRWFSKFHHFHHIRSENERRSITGWVKRQKKQTWKERTKSPQYFEDLLLNTPIEIENLLKVAKDFGKVDMKTLAIFSHHDVVVVTIAQTQHEGQHGAGNCGVEKVVDCLKRKEGGKSVSWSPVYALDPAPQGRCQRTDLSKSLRVRMIFPKPHQQSLITFEAWIWSTVLVD